MKRFVAFAIALLMGLGLAGQASADFEGLNTAFGGQPNVVAKVSLSKQQMELRVVPRQGMPKTYRWKVSTGRTGFETPTGSYRPTWLDIDHISKTYDDAPMPFAVFFTGGYAVHATQAIGRLGRPASHGCVRLATENAALFFEYVKTYGRWNTRIIITD